MRTQGQDPPSPLHDFARILETPTPPRPACVLNVCPLRVTLHDSAVVEKPNNFFFESIEMSSDIVFCKTLLSQLLDFYQYLKTKIPVKLPAKIRFKTSWPELPWPLKWELSVKQLSFAEGLKKFVHFIGTLTLFLDFHSLSYQASPYLYKQLKGLNKTEVWENIKSYRDCS